MAWRELFAWAGFLGSGAAAGWFAPSLSPPTQVLIWGALALTLAFLLRRGWLKLFGPLLVYDLIRTGRTGHHVLFRILYSLFLGYILLLVLLISFEELGIPLTPPGQGVPKTLARRELANFTLLYFAVFTCIQTLAVFLLTPAYTAGAVATEKERQSLDAFLTTDLRNREIVLSLMLSRMANLILILLTGLPILSLLEFLGGLDSSLFLAGFAFSSLTMAGLGALGILNSVRFPRARTAILRTYTVVILYLALSSLSLLLLHRSLGIASFPSTEAWQSPVTLGDVVGWLTSGNLFITVVNLVQGVWAGAALALILPEALARYALFNGVLVIGCTSWAVLRLRAYALAQNSGSGSASKEAGARPRRTVWSAWPGMAAAPLLWKEIAVEKRWGRPWVGRLAFGVLFAFCLIPLAHLSYWFGTFPLPIVEMKGLFNTWVRLISGIVGSAMLIQVGLRAAGTISGERAACSLDNLLTTPLEANSILFAKILGCVVTPRREWFLLAVVWAVGLATNALSPLAVPCYLAAWFVYACFMACLGTYFSVVCRSTTRAILGTLFATMGVLFVLILIAYNLWATREAALGIVPPIVLYKLPFYVHDFDDYKIDFRIILYASAALAAWVALIVLFGYMASLRFRLAIGRVPSKNDRKMQRRLAGPRASQGVVGTNLPTWAAAGLSEKSRQRQPIAWSGVLNQMSAAMKQRFRWWRRQVGAAWVVLIPLGLVGIVYLYFSLAGRATLARALKEADELDPGWRLEALEARRRLLPPEKNGALVIVAAQALPQFRGWERDISEAFNPYPAPTEQLNAKQIQTLGVEIAKAAPALREYRKLATMPEGRFPPDAARDRQNRNPFYSNRAQAAVHTLSWDSVWRAQQNDGDGALLSCQAMLNAGRSVGDQPSWAVQVERFVVIRELAERTERVLAQCEPSPEAMTSLQELLDDEWKQPRLLIGLRGYRAQLNQQLENLQFGEDTGGEFYLFRNLALNSDSLNILFSGSLQTQRASATAYLTKMVEIAKLPANLQTVEFNRLAASLTTAPFLVQRLIGPVGPINIRQDVFNAQLRCLMVGLAVERFRKKNQRWPTRLQELIPNEISGLPIDPLNGTSPFCVVTGDGVAISPVALFGQGTSTVSAGRLSGVRLWDPAHRRRPAKPTPP